MVSKYSTLKDEKENFPTCCDFVKVRRKTLTKKRLAILDFTFNPLKCKIELSQGIIRDVESWERRGKNISYRSKVLPHGSKTISHSKSVLALFKSVE